MRLYVNGIIFDIGQLGPDFLILRNAPDLPPAEGEIMLSINGHVRRWLVQLPDGITAGKAETRTADVSHGNGPTAG
jgi:hypothetical protein